MSTITFEVLHSLWGAGEDDVYAGGVHTLGGGECECGESHPKPTPEFLQLLAGAEASGAVEVLEISHKQRARLDGHVQSQEDGEAAYIDAQGTWVPPVQEMTPAGPRDVEPGFWDGPWRHGNLVNFVVEREDLLAYEAELPDDHWDKLDDAQRALVVHQLEQARAALATVEEPT